MVSDETDSCFFAAAGTTVRAAALSAIHTDEPFLAKREPLWKDVPSLVVSSRTD
jgi:hypothetical protein